MVHMPPASMAAKKVPVASMDKATTACCCEEEEEIFVDDDDDDDDDDDSRIRNIVISPVWLVLLLCAQRGACVLASTMAIVPLANPMTTTYSSTG